MYLTERELRTAALARDDDASRWVLADFLLELGDPAGELIAVQLELQKVIDPARHLQLKEREGLLLRQQHELWLARFGIEGGQILFDRGLPTTLALRRLRLRREDDDEPLQTLLGSPALPGLRSLVLQHNRLGPEGARQLAQAPGLASLRSLSILDNEVGLEGLRSLARSPHLRALSHLELASNGLGPDGARALLDTELAATLPSLGLARNRLGDEGARALAGSGLPLSQLDLGSNGLGREGIGALASSPLASGLRSLSLAGNPMGREALQALTRGELPRLESLDLATTGPALVELGELLLSTPLRSLSLGGNGLNGAALRALCRLPGLAQLAALDLSSNQMEPIDLWALSDCPHLPAWSELSLARNGLTDAALLDLKGSPLLALPRLDLRRNDLTLRGVQAMAPLLSDGAVVRLSGNRLSREEQRALLAEFGPRLSFD